MSPIVYVPPEKHDCEPPYDAVWQNVFELKYPAGAIWKCDRCGDRWKMMYEYRKSMICLDPKGRYATIKAYWNRLDD